MCSKLLSFRLWVNKLCKILKVDILLTVKSELTIADDSDDEFTYEEVSEYQRNFTFSREI